MDERREWITTGEAARMLGVRSINTVKRLIRTNRLTAIRPGGHYRVARRDVERLGSLGGVALSPDPMALLQAGWIKAWAAEHRVRRIWLFGSAARGEMGPQSDVDVAVEFEDDARGGLFELVAMQNELAERLDRPVDLGTLGSMRPYVRRNAERDLVLIHES